MLHDGEGNVIECQSTFQHHRAPPVCVAPQPCSEELRRSLTVAEGLHPWIPSSVFLPTKQANKKFDSDYRFASAAAVTEQSGRLRRPLPRHPGRRQRGYLFREPSKEAFLEPAPLAWAPLVARISSTPKATPSSTVCARSAALGFEGCSRASRSSSSQARRLECLTHGLGCGISNCTVRRSRSCEGRRRSCE